MTDSSSVDPWAIPPFLAVTAEEAAARKVAWKANPPRPMPRFREPPKSEEPATRALRLELARAEKTKERAKDKAKAAKRKETAALKKLVQRRKPKAAKGKR